MSPHSSPEQTPLRENREAGGNRAYNLCDKQSRLSQLCYFLFLVPIKGSVGSDFATAWIALVGFVLLDFVGYGATKTETAAKTSLEGSISDFIVLVLFR